MDKTYAELNWDMRWHGQEDLCGKVTQKLRLNDKGWEELGGKEVGVETLSPRRMLTAWACSQRDQREANVAVISGPGVCIR